MEAWNAAVHGVRRAGHDLAIQQQQRPAPWKSTRVVCSAQLLSCIQLFFFPFIFISWRLITLQYCGGFCHTLTWISHGFTCIPHPDPPSHLPLHPIPLFRNPMDYSLPASSVLGSLQERILEWVAISSSRGSSWSRDGTHISCIGRRTLYHQCHLGSYWEK